MNILNQKLEKEGSKKRFVEDPDCRPLDRMREDLDVIFSDESMKRRFLNGNSTFTFTHPIQSMGMVETRNIDAKEKLQENTFIQY